MRTRWILVILGLLLCEALPASAQVLDKQRQLQQQTFWENRDWAWYADNIPFFDVPVNTLDLWHLS